VLLWRVNRQRLEFEGLRDAMLAASGSIDLTIGGPAVDLGSQPFSRRRTIYGLIDRQNLPGMFRTFDFASPDTHSPQRYTTTVPQQALFLMNSPFATEQAQALAQRADLMAITDASARIERMYKILFARLPSQSERDWSLEFIAAEEKAAATGAAGQTPAAGAWEKFAQALMMTNEFMFVD
jgi:hypothetical protein